MSQVVNPEDICPDLFTCTNIVRVLVNMDTTSYVRTLMLKSHHQVHGLVVKPCRCFDCYFVPEDMQIVLLYPHYEHWLLMITYCYRVILRVFWAAFLLIASILDLKYCDFFHVCL